MDWVIARNNHPEPLKAVLACHFDRSSGSRYVNIDWIDDGGKWTSGWLGSVTHWMPLPDLPLLAKNPKEWRQACKDEGLRNYRETGAIDAHPLNPMTGKPVRSVIVHPNILRELYIKQNLSLEQLGVILSCSVSTVTHLLRREKVYRNLREQRKWEFGGHEKQVSGYVYVYRPEHPRANKTGYVPKHTLVMERHLGRFLESNEVVHHINHIRWDNRPENLMVMDREEHMRLHSRERKSKRPKSDPKLKKQRIDVERIRELYNDGLTDVAISEQLKCSSATVTAYRNKLGLPPHPRPYKKIDDAIAMAMYKAGASNRQIAARFGVKKNTVTAWRRTKGLPVGENKIGGDTHV